MVKEARMGMTPPREVLTTRPGGSERLERRCLSALIQISSEPRHDVPRRIEASLRVRGADQKCHGRK